jgi:predicted DNA-binding transcriptional regulator AlpA
MERSVLRPDVKNPTRQDWRALQSKKSDDAAEQSRLVTGPALRRLLNISAVTLWRWRHDKAAGFPAAKLINGRLYFSLVEVDAWIARQPAAA